MTSSDPDLGPVEPESGPAVLAAGHLHPAILFLRLLDGLRSAVWPLAIGLIAQEGWLIAIGPLVFVFTMAHAVIRYVTFRYVLTEEELITTEGVFNRQERRIPVDRIQDLNFEASLMRRFAGLVVVSVETASSQGAEAQLDSLGLRHAHELREAVQAVRGQRVDEEPADEFVLLRTSALDLTLLGLTNNKIGALVVGLFAVFEFADQLGMGGMVAGAGSNVMGTLSGLSTPFLAVVGVALLFLFLIAGWILAIIASFVKFHDFTLSLRDDVLNRRFGLITTRAQTLPRRRIQRVLLEQVLLRRLLNMVVVRADSAGSGMDEKEELRSGRDIVAPSAKREVGERLVPWLLPGIDPERIEFRPVSSRVVGRLFAEGVVFAAILAVVLWQTGGPLWAAGAAVIPPIAWLFGFLAHHNLGYRELDHHVALRWGITGRFRAFIPLQKVQAARLAAGPLDRMFGLASLVVYVAGGSPTRLHYLPRAEAERLELAIASRAARQQFVW